MTRCVWDLVARGAGKLQLPAVPSWTGALNSTAAAWQESPLLACTGLWPSHHLLMYLTHTDADPSSADTLNPGCSAAPAGWLPPRAGQLVREWM